MDNVFKLKADLRVHPVYSERPSEWILKSLKIIYEMKPEEIIISTSGPGGVIGLLTIKLMAVRVRGESTIPISPGRSAA